MERDAKKIRDEGPLVFTQVKHNVGVDKIVEYILHAWKDAVPTAVVKWGNHTSPQKKKKKTYHFWGLLMMTSFVANKTWQINNHNKKK